MFLSFQSMNQKFENLNIANISGNGTQWIFLSSQNISFNNLSMTMVSINGTSILELLLSSSMIINNSIITDFHPTFIYSSFSNLKVDNCSFLSTNNKKEENSVAIFLENYNAFKITNSRFDSLNNENNGPVNL